MKQLIIKESEKKYLTERTYIMKMIEKRLRERENNKIGIQNYLKKKKV